MEKAKVLDLYGGAMRTAARLGITHQAVYAWPEELPRSAERKVRDDLQKFLKASPAR